MRVGGLNFAEEGVELACRNTLIPGFQGLIHGSRQTVGVPAGLGGQIHTLGPHHTVEFGVPQAFETLLVELVHRIPLIEHEHDRTARIHGCGHDLQILIGYRLRSIKQDQRQFTALDGGLRAQRGIIFRACELVLASLDAGRVDEQPVLAIDVDDFVDGVARSAGQIVDHGTFFARQLIEQRRLAHVRAAHQSHAAQAGRREVAGSLLGLLELVERDVQQVAHSPAVHGGNRVWFAEAELPEFGGKVFAGLVVDLVDGQHDRLAGGTQHLDDALIGGGHAHLTIDNEYHSIGQGHGNLCL